MSETESLLEFPCQFPIKAMGENSVHFDSTVIELVRVHVEGLTEDAISRRPSSSGKYLSVTITIEATSRTQLDAIYQSLSDSPHVLMAL